MSGFHPYQAVLRQHLEGVELVLLEAAYNDDLKCEIEHIRTVCSGDVTHRISDRHGAAANMCATATEVKRRRIDDGGICAECRQPARDCWQIRPI